jgi:hypothetical protein
MLSADIKITLDTSILEKIASAVEAEANKSVQVGWFDTGDHPDKLFKSTEASTIAGVAARNEFGEDRNIGAKEYGVPPRPFIRPVINVRTREWQIGSLKRTASAAIRLKDTTGIRRSLGKYLKKELQYAIDQGTFLSMYGDNSPYIEKRKGFNKPLKGRTGLLRNTIKYRLENKGVV